MKRFKKVLIVDDDIVSQYLIKLVLGDIGIAQEIDALSNGKEAIEFVERCCLQESSTAEQLPDRILLDLNMPIRNGFEFLEHLVPLRTIYPIPSIVTILTSSEYKQDQEKAAQFEVKGYFIKPLTEESLQDWLKEYHPETK